jgi:UDPglucose 6-dehydrogenase
MKITIIGSGYVGLVTGACLAEVGNQVLCLDVDAKKIEILNGGGVPIHEPGLLEMVTRNRKAGRISFTTDIKSAVQFGEVLFIAVGTPPDEDGSADLKYVTAAATNIGRYMEDFKIVVDKSTVPVGTADLVRKTVGAEIAKRDVALSYTVVSNPEFLKEGAALDDFMRPDRIVLGCDTTAEGDRGKLVMRALYAPFQRNHERMMFMDVRSAELTKYAANAMLATRISFMNEMANLAERLGADIELVRAGIGSDPRIGYHFLYAGAGYGGSCFPKDVQALLRTSEEAGAPSRILAAVEAANDAQKHVLANKVVKHYGEDLSAVVIAVWGLAFKPNTDDMREAPSRVLVAELLSRGARIKVHDPVALTEARRVFALDFAKHPEWLSRIAYADTAEEALEEANALVIVTEWKAFRSPDFDLMREKLLDHLVIDGRNLYDPELLASRGLTYLPIGRARRAS